MLRLLYPAFFKTPKRQNAAFLGVVRLFHAQPRLFLHAFATLSIAFGLLSGSGIYFQAWAQENSFRIIGFGDSLMAGYQLDNDQSFPALLEKKLVERGHKVEVVNAGVSGDTSQAGLARLDWSVDDGANLVILELGANDMLRGLDPTITEKNLDSIVQNLIRRQIPVLLVGMKTAPNMGSVQAAKFDALYPHLAEKYQLPFYPFFLDGVAANLDLLLPDGMHPNEKGVAVMVERFLPLIEETLAHLRKNLDG